MWNMRSEISHDPGSMSILALRSFGFELEFRFMNISNNKRNGLNDWLWFWNLPSFFSAHSRFFS